MKQVPVQRTSCCTMRQQCAISLVPGNTFSLHSHIIHHDRMSSQNGSSHAAHILQLFTIGWSMRVAAIASQSSCGHSLTGTVQPEQHMGVRRVYESFIQTAYNFCVTDSGCTSVRMFHIRNYLTDWGINKKKSSEANSISFINQITNVTGNWKWILSIL
jgi:hypothetical protein